MKKIYLLLISFICLNFGYGQTPTPSTLAGFGTTNLNGTGNSVAAPNVSATGFTRSNVNLGGKPNNVGHRTVGWSTSTLAEAISAEEYIEWSITPHSEFAANITELKIQLSLEGTGGPGNFKIYSSTDGFTTHNELNPGVETLTLKSFFEYSGLNINSQFGSTITFRLYAWNATDKIDGQLVVINNSKWKLPSDTSGMSPGAVVIGSLSANFNGLLYSDGVWYPTEPSTATNPLLDARIQSGTYIVSGNANVKNLTVAPGAGITIKSTGTLKVHGHLITSDNVTVESSSSRFGSLIVATYVDTKNPSNPNIPAQVTGTAKYSRHVNGAGGNDLISAPVSGQNFIGFRTANPNLAHSPNYDLFLFGPFNKTTGEYDVYTNTSNDILEPGMGYRAAATLKGPLVFNGTVNVGAVPVPIVQTGPHAKEWNLIGNPYPSFIRFDLFLGENQLFLHEGAVAVYGYNPTGAKKWEIWNDASLETDSDLAMAPGQGFYVAARPEGGIIEFSPTMMAGSTKGDFVSGRTENKSTDFGFLKLNISNEGKNYDTELYFTDKATRGLDRGYDAMVYGGNKDEEVFSLYSHLVEDNKGTNMGIQSLPYTDLTAGVIIPVGIKASEGMQITVNISEFNLPEGTEVRLEDNSNNTFTLLNTSDYTFTAASNLTGTGRFFLHISTKPLSNKDDILNGLQVYTTNKSKTLYIKGLIKDQAQVNIYDIQGRLMRATQLKANTNSNEVDMSNLSTGIYVVELKSNALVKTQKVILK